MNIILISGASGVGTTSVASAILKKKDLLYLVGTDAIRESARQIILPSVNPYLHKSSYLAGKSEKYECKPEDIKKEKIVRGLKIQSSVVKVCIDGIINRYIKEGDSIIVEGVNLLPGDYNPLIENGLGKQVLLDIPNEELHLQRLKNRIKIHPQRGDRCLNNFMEIRLIRDYLLKKAIKNNIPIIDNSNNIECTIENCLGIIG